MYPGIPEKQGLYDPQFEHDSCGVGFIVDITDENPTRSSGKPSGSDQPAAPRRQGMRSQHGRRRRNHDADSARVLQSRSSEAGHQPARTRPLRRRDGVPAPRSAVPAALRRTLRAAAVDRTGQQVLGWRDVPTNNSQIGNSAKAVEPVFRQMFIAAAPEVREPHGFRAKALPDPPARGECGRGVENPDANYFYLSSLSCNTLIYKGMLSADRSNVFPGSGRIRSWNPRWPWFTSDSARTRFRAGRSRIRSVTSRTTAKSTRCAATSTG